MCVYIKVPPISQDRALSLLTTHYLSQTHTTNRKIILIRKTTHNQSVVEGHVPHNDSRSLQRLDITRDPAFQGMTSTTTKTHFSSVDSQFSPAQRRLITTSCDVALCFDLQVVVLPRSRHPHIHLPVCNGAEQPENIQQHNPDTYV